MDASNRLKINAADMGWKMLTEREGLYSLIVDVNLLIQQVSLLVVVVVLVNLPLNSGPISLVVVRTYKQQHLIWQTFVSLDLGSEMK